MKKQIVLTILAGVFSFSILGAASALAKSTPVATQTAKADVVTKVKTDEVCMVNNTHFGKTQLPVTVEGKTYYGCCENCKTTLNVDPSTRYSIEAWTGKKVDKATAVIAARADGSVLYFENEKNLKAYQEKNGKP